MRTAVLTSVLLAVMATLASAQIPYEVGQSSESSIDFYTSNHGIFGLDIARSRSGFTFPRGSSASYLFGSGLWFGARKRVDGELQNLTFLTYNPNSGASWATPGERPGVDTVSAGRPILYHSTDYDHGTGEYKNPTVPPLPPPNWPLWLRHGMQTTPLSPGEFVLNNSDRTIGTAYATPSFMPGVDEQFFSRFNDLDLERYEIAATLAQKMGYPLGLQMQQHIYGWRSGLFRNVVVLQYDIINVSNDTLFDCAVAQAADPDIGMANNDHLGFYTARPELRTSFVWTEPEATSYGTLAMTLLEGPVTDKHGYIDNSRRLEFLLHGRVASSPNWSIQNDPKTPQERYDMLTGGQIDTDTQTGDRRTLLATTKFTMRPGDTAHYTFAFVVLSEPPNGTTIKGGGGRTIAGTGGSQELETIVGTLMNDYYDAFTGTSSAVVGASATTSTVTAVPNPTASGALIGWTLVGRSAVTLDLRNSMGESMMTKSLGIMDAGFHQERLDVTTLPSGVYIIVVRSDQGARATRLAVTR